MSLEGWDLRAAVAEHTDDQDLADIDRLLIAAGLTWNEIARISVDAPMPAAFALWLIGRVAEDMVPR